MEVCQLAPNLVLRVIFLGGESRSFLLVGSNTSVFSKSLCEVLHAKFLGFVGNVLGPWAEKSSWVLLWLEGMADSRHIFEKGRKGCPIPVLEFLNAHTYLVRELGGWLPVWES